jgi:predicted outer membrane lipoprotein
MNQPPKNPQKNPNDFVLGLLMFVAFIIFMALWLHFELPESDQHPSLTGRSGSERITHAETQNH